MKYGTADRALESYLDALSECQRRGFNPKGIEGFHYAQKCPSCGGTKWRKQHEVERCTGFKCGMVRPSSLIFIPKSYFHQRKRRSRTGESLHAQRSATSALDAIAELGLVFQHVEKRARWPLRALVAYVVFETYPAALEVLERRWPRGPGRDARGVEREEPGWTLWLVQGQVRAARQKVETELDYRGLL